jgi:hypothetical protein
MPTEAQRGQWREAQEKHRQRVAAGLPPLRVRRRGSKKAHKPSAVHPWVRDTDGFSKGKKPLLEFEEQESESVSLDSLGLGRRNLFDD